MKSSQLGQILPLCSVKVFPSCQGSRSSVHEGHLDAQVTSTPSPPKEKLQLGLGQERQSISSKHLMDFAAEM